MGLNNMPSKSIKTDAQVYGKRQPDPKSKSKYKFLVDYRGIVKKGQILEAEAIAGSYVPPSEKSKITIAVPKIKFRIVQPNGAVNVIQIPQIEIGKTIEKVIDDKAPTNTGGTGTTTGTTTTQTQSGLFTTKNIVIGVIVLAVAYYGYKKYVKKGKN